MRCAQLIRLALAALLLALVCVGSAQAKTCNVSGAWTSFGTYDPITAAEVLTIGTITVHCNEDCHAERDLEFVGTVSRDRTAKRRGEQFERIPQHNCLRDAPNRCSNPH